MRNALRALWAGPQYDAPVAHLRATTAMTITRGIVLGLVVLYPALLLGTAPSLSLMAPLLLTTALIGGAVSLVYTRRPRAALWVLIGAAYFGGLGSYAFGGGVIHHGMAGPIMPVLIASIALGVRAGAAVAVAVFIGLASLVLGERAGHLPVLAQAARPEDTLLANAAVTIFALVLLHVLGRQLRKSMADVRELTAAGTKAACELEAVMAAHDGVRHVFDRIGHGVLLVSRTGAILESNLEMARVAGTPRRPTGTLTDLLTPIARIEACLREAASGAKAKPVHGFVQRSGDDPLPVTVHAVQQQTSDGPLLITVRDRTAELAAARLKGQFVSFVSHELRTPLTAIRGALGLLEGKPDGLSEAGHQLARMALSNTLRLNKLVDAILDIEKLDSGRLVLERTLQDLRPILEQACAPFPVKLVLPKRAMPSLIAAPRVVQALENVLENAAHFGTGTQPTLVTLSAEAHTVCIRVHDDGPGFAPAYLQHAFERFSQADASDTRARGGTGLGLALSHAIVRAHGGDMCASNAQAGGAVVDIFLPLAEHAHAIR